MPEEVGVWPQASEEGETRAQAPALPVEVPCQCLSAQYVEYGVQWGSGEVLAGVMYFGLCCVEMASIHSDELKCWKKGDKQVDRRRQKLLLCSDCALVYHFTNSECKIQ